MLPWKEVHEEYDAEEEHGHPTADLGDDGEVLQIWTRDGLIKRSLQRIQRVWILCIHFQIWQKRSNTPAGWQRMSDVSTGTWCFLLFRWSCIRRRSSWVYFLQDKKEEESRAHAQGIRGGLSEWRNKDGHTGWRMKTAGITKTKARECGLCNQIYHLWIQTAERTALSCTKGQQGLDYKYDIS